VSHTRVPASFTARQSPSVLHSTQLPAMLPLLVSPQTCADGSLPVVHGDPVGALVKHGVSGDGPQHEGLMRHWLLDGDGRSVGSSIAVSPPEPSHTFFWQSPGTCSEAGASVLPG
jgi:hypothetical protein